MGEHLRCSLAPGRDLEDAQREMDALAGRIHEAFPDPEVARSFFERAQIGLAVTPLKEDVVGGVSEVLWILFGCVGVVLAIAIANVANLFLVRAESRNGRRPPRRSRRDAAAIARGTTVESLIITIAGSMGGLALAAVGIRAFLRFAPPGMPRLDEIAIDLRVVVFAMAIAILSGLVLGAIPALRRTDDLSPVLDEGGRTATGGRVRQPTRDLLVVFQLALALMLIVLSGLMVRSFVGLRATDPGCDPRGVVTMRLPIPGIEYPEPADSLEFYREVLEKVRALPGVDLAGVITGVPVEDSGTLLGHSFEDAPLDEDEIAPNYKTHLVLPGSLDVLSIPLVAGRKLRTADLQEEVRTVLISESLARRVWPDPTERSAGGSCPGGPRMVVSGTPSWALLAMCRTPAWLRGSRMPSTTRSGRSGSVKTITCTTSNWSLYQDVAAAVFGGAGGRRAGLVGRSRHSGGGHPHDG